MTKGSVNHDTVSVQLTVREALELVAIVQVHDISHESVNPELITAKSKLRKAVVKHLGGEGTTDEYVR